MAPTWLSRNQHYVPRSYLKRWSDQHNRLWVYRFLVPHENVPEWKRASVKEIGYHTDLYTRVVMTVESDEFEHWLNAEFESQAEPVIRRAVADARLTRRDWFVLIRFLAAQDIRTPARLLEMLHRWRSGHLDKLLDTALRDSVARLESELAWIIHEKSGPWIEEGPNCGRNALQDRFHARGAPS